MTAKMYDDALYLQSAVNPGPIVRRFSEMIGEITEELKAEHGQWWTEGITSHPVFRLMCSKLHDMGGYDQHFSEAYDACVRRADPKTLALLGIPERSEVA